jgi:hypothetical protein
MAKPTKKDIQISDLTEALKIAKERAEAGRILSARLFCYLIEVNKQLAEELGIERHYGSVESHIDFNIKIVEKVKLSLEKKRTVTVTIT